VIGIRDSERDGDQHTAMNGKVARSKLRLPKVSIVQNAGNAKTKLMTPKPRDASNAGVG
jgi:hypothetical protein